MIDQSLSRESNHCGGIGLRGDVTQVVLTRDIGVPTNGGGAEFNVDPDLSNEVGDTL